jgi:hypothetical protein
VFRKFLSFLYKGIFLSVLCSAPQAKITAPENTSFSPYCCPYKGQPQLLNDVQVLGWVSKGHFKSTLKHVSRLYYSNIYPTRCNVTQFILSGNCSTCFGWYHPKHVEQFECAVGGVRHPQHTQTGSNSSTIAADSSNGVTNTRFCRYSCLRS